MGVSREFDKYKDKFNYMIAIEEIQYTIPKEYISAVIPAATCAAFESVGPMPEANT